MGAEGRKCSICGTGVARLNRLICNQCKHLRDKERWRDNYESYVSSRIRIAKARAKKHGFSFAIDKDYILEILERQNYRCAITGFPLSRTSNKGDYDLSIDRVDSDLGYEKDNVVLVCNRANIMKNIMPLDMFVWWCQAIANYDQDRRSRKKT